MSFHNLQNQSLDFYGIEKKIICLWYFHMTYIITYVILCCGWTVFMADIQHRLQFRQWGAPTSHLYIHTIKKRKFSFSVLKVYFFSTSYIVEPDTLILSLILQTSIIFTLFSSLVMLVDFIVAWNNDREEHLSSSPWNRDQREVPRLWF